VDGEEDETQKYPPAKRARSDDAPEDAKYMQEEVQDDQDEEDGANQSVSEQEQEDEDMGLQGVVNDEVAQDNMEAQNELAKEQEEFLDEDFIERKEDQVDVLEPYVSREPSSSIQPADQAGEPIEEATAETEEEEMEEPVQGVDSTVEKINEKPSDAAPSTKSELGTIAERSVSLGTNEQEGNQLSEQSSYSQLEDPDDLQTTCSNTHPSSLGGKTPREEEEDLEDEESESAEGDSQAELGEGSEIEEERTENEELRDDEQSVEENDEHQETQ